MDAQVFLEHLLNCGIEFFTGVPDSLLKPFCDCLMDTFGVNSEHHVIAHNEGGCVALASGHYLATGKAPCVFMQNSGIGNMANPAISLSHPKVYAIPILYVIGWRGEPGTSDEPQHIYQGEVTLSLLSDIGIEGFVLNKNTTELELLESLNRFKILFADGKSAAIVICKNALAGPIQIIYKNNYILNREKAIATIVQVAKEDIIVSTTGKISRELYEIREVRGIGHDYDFLTVGSMGHSLMIALGIALNKKSCRVWCLDGDGAFLMHMGAIGVVGSLKPKNFIHIVLNNEAHETVGGMPTVLKTMNLSEVVRASGYRKSYLAETEAELKSVLNKAISEDGPIFIEMKVALGSRRDLGRPKTAAIANKQVFMDYLRNI